MAPQYMATAYTGRRRKGMAMGMQVSPKSLLATVAIIMMTQHLVIASEKEEANFAILSSLGLPVASIKETFIVDKKCQCVTICRTSKSCKVITLEVYNSLLYCHLSVDNFDYFSMVEQGNTSITWLDYEKQGQRYYKIYSNKKWQEAFDHCRAEGGQLAIANTPDKETEVSDIMKSEGLDRAWVGLYKNTSALIMKTAWLPRTGQILYESRHAESTGSRCFILKITNAVALTTNQGISCHHRLSYICQRTS
ncbi:uncharacterized protein LOC122251683 [Penaeus japonicus]|uniref:uncharacterized protein LOC122251683 n=1 Tax=Penaeus japonicus TaxID=27405 RepID=UPI001C7173B5|nr:uncharacterized protein LOC122251683 [Penaeus japonicus]